jgi:hypothetical protein
MAKTGESYSTARRQVLRRLGNGAPVADQPEASEARRWHRARIGVVGLVLAVAVAAVVVISSVDEEGPKQPSVGQQAFVTPTVDQLDQIDQTPVTVVELNGETHPGVVNNAIVVPCGGDGKVAAVPVDDPTSEAAKRDAQEVARESCKN